MPNPTLQQIEQEIEAQNAVGRETLEKIAACHPALRLLGDVEIEAPLPKTANCSPAIGIRG